MSNDLSNLVHLMNVVNLIEASRKGNSFGKLRLYKMS